MNLHSVIKVNIIFLTTRNCLKEKGKGKKEVTRTNIRKPYKEKAPGENFIRFHNKNYLIETDSLNRTWDGIKKAN